jgi:hypothetical protein
MGGGGAILPHFTPESIELFIENQAFTALYALALPPPAPPLVRSQSSCVSPDELTDEMCTARIKKKFKFFSYIRKFRMEQLQSHI